MPSGDDGGLDSSLRQRGGRQQRDDAHGDRRPPALVLPSVCFYLDTHGGDAETNSYTLLLEHNGHYEADVLNGTFFETGKNIEFGVVLTGGFLFGGAAANVTTSTAAVAQDVPSLGGRGPPRLSQDGVVTCGTQPPGQAVALLSEPPRDLRCQGVGPLSVSDRDEGAAPAMDDDEEAAAWLFRDAVGQSPQDGGSDQFIGFGAISKVPAAGATQIVACSPSQDQSAGTPASAGACGLKVMT